ncbi:hypothetical protein GCM10022268_23870 [Sphingomonas cynarae]|uniref:Transposase n=1 Tax=Sphingomonas cynarae TaxID=930197 RepID=A0ABP7E723_9SPHN
MAPIKGALRPKCEAPRAVLADRRGTTNYIRSNTTPDSTKALRLQRLRLIGIIGLRAEILAALAWETSHG